MTRTLRIRDWDSNFETHKTRPKKGSLPWIKLPSKLENPDYIDLVSGDDLVAEQDGAGHLGAWVGIVEFAATCNPRGALVKKGAPVSEGALAKAIRMPVSVVSTAIERLLRIGWLEVVPEERPSSDGAVTGDRPTTAPLAPDQRPVSAGTAPLDKRREDKTRQDQIRGEKTVTPEVKARLDEFLSAYPKKTRQGHAVDAYMAVVPDQETHTEVMAGLARWMESSQWQDSLAKDGGKFVPAPDRWLIDRRWTEYPTPARRDPFEEAKKLA